jgi:tetrahydromethanopterin S-methyltransferase subunit G
MGENNRDIDRRMVFGDTQKKNPPFPEPELPKEHVVYDFIKSLFDIQQFNLSVESIEETGHTVLEHLDKRSDDTIKKLYKRFDKIFEKFTRRIDDIEELKLAMDYATAQRKDLRQKSFVMKKVEDRCDEMHFYHEQIHHKTYLFSNELSEANERLDEMEDGLDLINQKLDTLLRRKR